MFYDKSLTPSKTKRPDYKVSTREYSVDNISKWTAGDSDKHHYELTESERLQDELEPIDNDSRFLKPNYDSHKHYKQKND